MDLSGIIKKYCGINYNDNNFSIGGGLDDAKFASRRHEDAKCDKGKLTLGKATQLFKNATSLPVDKVREVLIYAVPNMEWHHAGKLPKSYGGGMKKTYFLNAEQICHVASNWDSIIASLDQQKAATKSRVEKERDLENRRLAFLNANAKRIARVRTKPEFFYLTAQEMNGKYGWFDSTNKSYKLDEYYSGWEFENEEVYLQFLSIK